MVREEDVGIELNVKDLAVARQYTANNLINLSTWAHPEVRASCSVGQKPIDSWISVAQWVSHMLIEVRELILLSFLVGGVNLWWYLEQGTLSRGTLSRGTLSRGVRLSQ